MRDVSFEHKKIVYKKGLVAINLEGLYQDLELRIRVPITIVDQGSPGSNLAMILDAMNDSENEFYKKVFEEFTRAERMKDKRK